MAAKRNLRVATEADAKPAKPKTLEEAAECGDDLEFLKMTLREMIRDRRDMTGPAKAAIYRQIVLVKRDISALEAAATEEAAEDAEVADEEFDAEAL